MNYKDLTPRVAVAWDVRGNGKTAVKFSMERNNAAAGIGAVTIPPRTRRAA